MYFYVNITNEYQEKKEFGDNYIIFKPKNLKHLIKTILCNDVIKFQNVPKLFTSPLYKS